MFVPEDLARRARDHVAALRHEAGTRSAPATAVRLGVRGRLAALLRGLAVRLDAESASLPRSLRLG